MSHYSMLNFYYINYVLDYDDCTSKPCMNGGQCTDGVKTYMCQCTPDYKGDNCETGDQLIVDIMLCLKYLYTKPYTVKPVLRGHLWDNEKVVL